MKIVTILLSIPLLVAYAAPCLGAEEPPVLAPGSPSASEQARQCFNRGVELYDEHDLDGAEVEFQHAYALAKNFHLLYNLGQIANERHDYATALDFFKRYLREGGDEIPADRRQSVEIEVAKLGTRVARLEIIYSGPTADVLVDDVVIGRTPLASPLTVNMGHRRVQLRPKEGESQTRILDVLGGELVLADFQPVPARIALPTKVAEGDVTQPAALVPAQPHTARRVAWIVTGICALGAITSGIVAYEYANDLQKLRQTFPVTRDALDSQQRKVRYATWTTDGLAATTAVLATVSVLLSLDRDPVNESTKLSLGWSWPGILHLSSVF